MRLSRSLSIQLALPCAFMLFFSLSAAGQGTNVPARVSEAVDVQRLVTLQGNTHPLARPAFDHGAAPDSLPMQRMLLVLQRSREQEAALRHVLDEQQTQSSPNFHKWLTPEEFGQHFGPADADIQAVTDWLTTQGFQVNRVAAGRTIIEFSGTAALVRQALHTEIHKFVVNNEEHWANASDPQIPAALTPVVAGVASLNNFPRKPMYRPLGTFSRSKATGEVRPLFTFAFGISTLYAVGPNDFATIYGVKPLWDQSIDGTGQTIAIAGQTNINIQDVRDFRSMFGLPANDPQIVLNGPDPGILSGASIDEGEGDLDVQWAGAVAKGATVKFVISETTESTAGIDLSALYIVDNNLAPVMSESYGLCELFLGTAGNSFYSTLWEQATAQGITVIIASGDNGSAGCDAPPEIAAQYGAMVDGTASTPFNIAVGGTDFNDPTSQSTYWNGPTGNSSPAQSSAKSYIPETTWNDSCARLGQASDCTSPNIDGADIVAASGGQSNCATSTSFGTCTGGYPKPSWQTGNGVPNDSVRDIPDVSLFASDGLYSRSFYVTCQMDANTGTGSSTSSCDLNSPYADFQGVGGTSASAPAFAGIMALVNQAHGRQGNANYVLYKLAAKTGASCTSNAAAVSSSSCIFYDVNDKTASNNNSNISVACAGSSPNCSNVSAAAGQYGILVVNPTANPQVPAWNTTAGYDLATGLGSVNAANLVNNWTSVTFTPSTTTLSLSTTPATTPITLAHGQAANVSIQVSSGTGTPTGDVSLIAQISSSQNASPTTFVDAFTLSSGSVSSTTSSLPGGTYGVTAHYAGDGTFGASDSSPAIQVTVTPESSVATIRMVTFDQSGFVTNTNATTAQYGSPYVFRVDVTNTNNTGAACYDPTSGLITYPCPTGTVTVTDNGSPFPPSYDQGAPPSNTTGTYALNSQGHLEDMFIQFPAGAYNLVANYQGDSSYLASTPATAGRDAITITTAPTATTVSVPPSASTGLSVTLTASVTTQSLGAGPSGTITFFNGGTQIGSPVTVTGTPYSPSTGAMATSQATLSTSFTSAGTASITATYSGDSNYVGSTSTAATITITATPDFNFSANPTSLTVTAGNSGTSTLTITPLNGFTGGVTLGCSGVPAGATCLASPSFVNLTSSGANSTLTVTTTKASVTPPASQRRVPPNFRLQVGLPWLVAGLLALAMLMGLTAVRRRPALSRTVRYGALSGMVLATTLLVVGVWAACGGGGGGGGGGTTPAPAVSLSPASLTFASQNTGTTSTAQSVALSNTGNAALSISSVAISGTNAGDFAQTNTCGGSVAAGANCTIGVTFTPTAAGTRSASLAITDNATGSPHTVSLTGTGVAQQPTPPGTYTLTVTATSGSLSHTATVTVTVQ